ncbi:DNA polymerase epsilon subunit C [Cladophialophora carrionii]|uniref:DNA polymerase epsilon subunit C n=1 Tax=Cladophialophora carrionii TaxID=86049 RepID=A0A1C1CNW8_9EURO|nr:DNA polymerase epsilon subunit C [Cladophialophora carrionii]
MDILTRLIAGSGSSPTKQRTNIPAERLASCKSICNALTAQHTWRSGNVEREDEAALNYTLKLLQRLEAILHDESRRAAPHSCLRYVASSQAYIIITKLAVSSSNTDIIKTSAQLFHILINGEAEGLLDSKLFTRSLLDLVCFATIGGRIIVEERLQTDLVELLFEIATKIRLDPDILPAWFYPDRETTRGRNAADDTRRSQFPLFHVLVQYVHHDGPVGDFARTALLYLTETASKFKLLETWMIESDLAPQMASGLGALYSRLSRQSTTSSVHGSAPPIVLLSDHAESISLIAEPPPELQQDSKAFFTYLAFWQDTLNHCKSVEVSDTLLDHFQVLFVQQLLYPSLLESSDVEGGSTAAVIDHLSQILRALHHLQLVDRILQYLLASPDMPQHPRDRGHRRQRMSVSRRKSIDHLKALAEVADSPSPNLFNLFDLMVMSLKSRHAQTVNACLRLLSVILEHHHSHVLPNLFRLVPTTMGPGQRSVKHLNNSLLKLIDYSATIAKNPDMDASYQGVLSDGQVILEQHSCFRMDESEMKSANTTTTSISHECKLFEAILTLLRTFFANDTTTNLSLTRAILDLAACQHMDVHGWLLPSDGRLDTEDRSMLNVTYVVSDLVEQVRQWRSQFTEWDQLITRRRLELDDEEPPFCPSDPGSVTGQARDTNASERRTSPSTINPRSRPTTPKKTAMTEFGSIDSTVSMTRGNQGSLVERALAHSPLRQSMPTKPEQDDLQTQQHGPLILPPAPTTLKTQIQLLYAKAPEEASESLPVHAGRKQSSSPAPDRRLALRGSDESGTATPVGGRDEDGPRGQVSLSHVLTNAIILQEFILELTAIIQLRATFFNEVDFGTTVSD